MTTETTKRTAKRHSLRCRTCRARFVRRGDVLCQLCLAIAPVAAPRPAMPTRNPGRSLGHLSRREGMAEFVPEYHAYARRFVMAVLAIILAMIACR